jgi:hypothetical protein
VYNEEGEVVGRASESITLAEAMHIYANSKNAKNRAHLEGTGLDLLSLAEVSAALPAEAKQAVDEWIDYYDNEVYPRVSAVFQRTFGLPLPKEAGYFPLMRLDTQRSDNHVILDLMQRTGSLPPSVYKKFVKARTGSRAPFKDYNFWKTIQSHMRHVEHYVAFEEPINRVRRLTMNKDVKAALQAKSEIAARRLNEWIGELSTGPSEKEMTGWETVSDTLIRNYAVFALGINPRVMAKQLGSIPLGLVYSGNPALVARYATEFVTNHDQLVDTVLDKSDFMRGRQKRINQEMEDFRKSKEWAQMSGATWGKKITADIRDGLMGGIRGFDAAAVYPLWMGTYYHARFNKGMSEADAVRRANTVIRRTQPTGGKENLPKIMRQKGFMRMFTMFKNQLNKQYNIAAQLSRAVRYADIPAGQKTALVLANTMAFMVSGFYMYLIDRAFVRAMMFIPKRAGEAFEELKDDWGSIARYIAGQPLGGFIIGGDMINHMLAVAYNFMRKRKGMKPVKLYSPSHTLPFEDFMVQGVDAMDDMLQAAGDVADEDYEAAMKSGRSALDFVAEGTGVLTGLFPGMAYRMGKGYTRVENMDITDEAGPLNVFYSRGALEDRTMKAAQANRLLNPKTYDDKIVFLKWYDTLPATKQERFRLYVNERVLEDPPPDKPWKKPKVDALIERYRMSMSVHPGGLPDPSEPTKKLQPVRAYMPTAQKVQGVQIPMLLHTTGPLGKYGRRAKQLFEARMEGMVKEAEYRRELAKLKKMEERFVEKLKGVGVNLAPNAYTVPKEK